MPAKGLDEENLEFVDSSEVPLGRIKVTKWQNIFGKIPAGKALVLSEAQVSFVAVRCSLYELQKKGLFKNLAARKVKESDGSYKMYVLNNAKK